MIFFTQEKALCYPDIYNSVHQPTAIEWIHDIHVLIFPAAARRRQGGRLAKPRNHTKPPRGRNHARVISDARTVSPPFCLFCSARLPGVTRLTEPLRSDAPCRLPFAAHRITSRSKRTSCQPIPAPRHELFQSS